ncbi:ParB N-terminal domain-containing protein [Streptomyces sp. NPDC048606]|uniref:ParB N-terminal domain-containing protein n=1 Tax=Streptomyces sp. NPDC048606 TaxID=3154726 RepID=UPI00341A71C3
MRRLAEIVAQLPPVLVHRPTMRVVDGTHRIEAARMMGLDSVEVRFFDGPEEEVFLRSVAANIAHGLPLSLADRKAAALRVLASRPHLSDRTVAGHTGLDAKTVASVRRCSAVGLPALNARTGADGRVHPLDRTAERLHAAELMTKDPDLPLRAVVRETGLSLGTAHDVRRRLRLGEDPVPAGRQGAGPGRSRTPPSAGSPDPAPPTGPTPLPAPAVAGAPSPRRREADERDRRRRPLDTLRGLAGDPSLRQSESGRDFIRWMHTHFVLDEAWRKRVDAIPPHCNEAVAEMARHCSESWLRFAEDLTARRISHHTVHFLDLSATQATRH